MKTRMLVFFHLSIAVTLLLLAGCSGAASQGASDLPTGAVLSELSGTVEMKNPGEEGYSPASTGAILQVQGQVRTGSDGSLRLDLASGTIIRIAPDSLFTLATNLPAEGSLQTRLVMQAGQVWVILNGGSMEVETPSGTASVRGSYLSVWVDPVSLDAWVTCLEGWCQAENPTALMDMVAGEGATLYYFDPEGSIPPPPPLLRYLTQQEIDEFLLNNPEAEGILHAMIATASALPPLEDNPVPTEAPECFTLGLPEKEGEVAADGFIQFDWNDQPEAYKYILTVVKPNGAERSWITFKSSIKVDALDLPLEGTYSWSVTAYDASIHPLCTSETWTFSKPLTEQPEDVTCFELLTPEQDAELAEEGDLLFTWSEQPDRYKYIISITAPDGSETSKIVYTNNYLLPAVKIPLEGEYHWQVTAYDASIKPICTAGPRAFTKPGTEIPTPEPGSCVTLLAPENGAELDADGPEEFTWTEHPRAYKYLIYFKGPKGLTDSIIAMEPYHLRYMGSLPSGGTYEWWVAAKDSSLNIICTSEHRTFNKPESTIPTEPPPGPEGTFWDQSGPTGEIDSCVVTFSVRTNPDGGIVKVVYSTDSNVDGYSDPHYVLDYQGDSRYAASVELDCLPEGKVIYWRFAIFNGSYIHDANVYSFTSPGCPLEEEEEEDQPTVFISIDGPGEVVSSFPVFFGVQAEDPQGLQYVKVQYQIKGPGGEPIGGTQYQKLSFDGSRWVGELSFGELESGSTVTWWIWAIDNNGKSTYSDSSTFVYTP